MFKNMRQILAFTAIKKHPNKFEILWQTRQMGTKIAINKARNEFSK
jgi:hypothetical protein